MSTERRTHLTLIAALVGALALAACSNQEQPAPTAPPAGSTPPANTEKAPAAEAPAPESAVKVDSVDLGTAVGADQKISTPTTDFAPTDTIYAAVSTSGTAPNAVLDAKWTFQDGQTVNESSQTIAPNGPAVTTFHISKPDGWPAGSYKVEIALNGQQVASKDFTVK